MHSGYPIMTLLDVLTAKGERMLPPQVDIVHLTTEGSWGHVHEIGHNMQRSWWGPSGCGEVTNNIFSLWGGWLCCNLTVLENIKNKYPPMIQKLNSSLDMDKTKFRESLGAFDYLVYYAL